MMKTTIWKKAVLLLLTAVWLLPAVTDAVERPVGERGGDLWRIEAAYEVGLLAAGSPEERTQCLRLRNVALAALAERTYESLLTLLAGRGGALRVLEGDQRLWRRQLATDEADPERVSTLLLNRLRTFERIMEAYKSGVRSL